MDVVEAPRMNDRCIPEGSVVVVALDPVASVAALQDEQATLEALSLPKGKYLAVVDTYHGFDFSKPVQDMALGFSFFTVGHGVPDPAFASIALSSDQPAQNNRRPIIPSPPLRWPDCYVYTLECFYARIARVYLCQPPNLPTKVTEEERVAISHAVVKDQYTAGLALRDADGELLEVPPANTDSEVSLENNANDYADNSGVAMRGDTQSSNASPKDIQERVKEATGQSSAASVQSDSSAQQEPLQAWAHVEVWLDLASIVDFDEPQRLMDTLSSLRRIERDSASRRVLRMLAHQPRTAQWAQDVAISDYEPPPEAPIGVAAVDDMSVMPQDAVDNSLDNEPTGPALDGDAGRRQSSDRNQTRPRSLKKRVQQVFKRVFAAIRSPMKRVRDMILPPSRIQKRENPSTA